MEKITLLLWHHFINICATSRLLRSLVSVVCVCKQHSTSVLFTDDYLSPTVSPFLYTMKPINWKPGHFRVITLGISCSLWNTRLYWVVVHYSINWPQEFSAPKLVSYSVICLQRKSAQCLNIQDKACFSYCHLTHNTVRTTHSLSLSFCPVFVLSL